MHPESHLRVGVTYPTLAELKLLTDDQLMVQLQAGANDALAVLFERHHRLVFSIALKIVRDRGEAEDVTQNVFLEIFRSVAQFDPAKGTLKSVVIAICLSSRYQSKTTLEHKEFLYPRKHRRTCTFLAR